MSQLLMYNRRKLQWHVRGLLLHSCSVCRGWFLITLLPLNVAWFVRVWLTIRWHNMTIVMIKTGLGARLTRTSPEATKKTRANLFKWIHIHILRTQHSINTQSLKHIGEHRPMAILWGGGKNEIRFRERSLIEGSESMVGWRRCETNEWWGCVYSPFVFVSIMLHNGF